MNPHIDRTMKLWADEPLNTAVIDFEYTAGRKGHRKVLQMAIANAHGEWIVPSTNINYGTSSEELESEIDHLATGSFQSVKAIRKIYDVQDESLLPWRTPREIADMIEHYTTVCFLHKPLSMLKLIKFSI